MRKYFTIIGLGVALLGIFAVSPAIAQSTSQNMPMRGMIGGGCQTMGMMDGRGMSSGMMRGRAGLGAMAEGRLAYLKSELQITGDQEAEWQEYADAVKARVAIMQGMRESMTEDMQNGNALERMDARIGGMEAMLEAMKAIKPATEKLYGVLTPEQNTTADQLIGSDCGAM